MKLHLASGNLHKLQEMSALAAMGDPGVTLVSARDVGGMPPVEEDTGTFIGNARKKARALQAKLPGDAWVLADDSGVCVDALNGAPGVESAYYAGPAGDGAANLRKLVETMRGVPEGKRAAAFVCVLLLMGPGGQEQVFEARITGTLLEEPRGGAGFGYDPIFVPEGHTRTYAELTDAEKNGISHRSKAWAQLTAWLRQSPRQPLRWA
jgi:XTP/dITP diphosphohydrolase